MPVTFQDSNSATDPTLEVNQRPFQPTKETPSAPEQINAMHSSITATSATARASPGAVHIRLLVYQIRRIGPSISSTSS